MDPITLRIGFDYSILLCVFLSLLTFSLVSSAFFFLIGITVSQIEDFFPKYQSIQNVLRGQNCWKIFIRIILLGNSLLKLLTRLQVQDIKHTSHNVEAKRCTLYTDVVYAFLYTMLKRADEIKFLISVRYETLRSS